MKKWKLTKHWQVVLACMLLQGSAIGIVMNCFGVFTLAICEQQGFMIGEFSLYSTIRSASGAILFPLFYPLIYKKWRNYNQYVSMGLAVLLFGGMMITTLLHSVWAWYAVAVITGLGIMFFTINQAYVIGNWFESKQGVALGIAGTASGIIGAVFAPISSWLIIGLGWQWAMLILNALGLVMAILGSSMISFTPEEKGYEPYRETQSSQQLKPVPEQLVYPVRWAKWMVLFVVAALFTNIVVANNLNHLPNYAQNNGYTIQIAALFSTFVMFGNIGGKLLYGTLIDRFAFQKVLFAAFLFVGIALAGLMSFGSILPLALACAMILGTSQSVHNVLSHAFVKNMFGKQQYEKMYTNMVAMIMLMGAPTYSLAGYSFDLTGNYQGCMGLGVALYVVTLLFMMVAFGIRAKQAQEVYIEQV